MIAIPKCNISFKVDYSSTSALTAATYSYKLKNTSNIPTTGTIPLPLATSNIIDIPADGLANGEYDLIVTLTSGSVTTSNTSTFKIGNCGGSTSPIAVARWADNSSAPKTVEWQVSNPTLGAWYGYYGAQLTGSYSSDSTGSIVGYYWQYNLNGAGWTDLDPTSSSFPNIPSPSKTVQTDGNWKFRVKVKDNSGLESAWSNELVLNITGSNLTGNSLNVFQLQLLSGGFGYYNTMAMLSISPITEVHKLVAKTQSYTNPSGSVMENDFFLKIEGNGILEYNAPAVGIERDITSIMSDNMTIWMDLSDMPTAKSVQVDFIAYDVSNAVIGTRTIQMGNTGTAIAYVANGDSMSFPINVTSNKKVKVIVDGIVNMNPGWHVVLANGLNPPAEMYDLVSNETKIFNLVLVPGNTYYLMSNSIQGPTGTSATVELIDA